MPSRASPSSPCSSCSRTSPRPGSGPADSPLGRTVTVDPLQGVMRIQRLVHGRLQVCAVIPVQ
eukprot:9463132-Pyramimonas_sp.AAC.1